MSEIREIGCEEALRQLLTFLDRELEEDRQREVGRHLDLCRSCYSRAEFERRLKQHLAELGRQQVNPALEARVRSLIAEFTCS